MHIQKIFVDMFFYYLDNMCIFFRFQENKLTWNSLVYAEDAGDGDMSPDSKVHGANMGPTWVLSAPDGPHVGSMNLAIREGQ